MAAETWVYCGRRYSGREHKLYRAWRDEAGVERTYSKLTASVVGGIYEVNATREGESVSVSRSVHWTGDVADDQAVLVAHDRRAATDQATTAAERKAAKNTALDAALAPLLELVDGMSYADRIAIANVVHNSVLGRH